MIASGSYGKKVAYRLSAHRIFSVGGLGISPCKEAGNGGGVGAHAHVHTANELDSCGQNEWAPRATLGMFLAVVNGRQSYSTKLSRPFAGSNRSQKKSWR